MSLIAFVVVAALLLGAVAIRRRNRERLVDARNSTVRDLAPGTEVMTTSGLYAIVLEIRDDDTATLSIAPNVEVKWAAAALRRADEVPVRYRRGMTATPHADPLDKLSANWPPAAQSRGDEVDTN